MKIITDAVDWVSIKLNAVCLIGLISGSNLIIGLTAIATLSTILYNSIRIYKLLKKK
jgi:hypothetical protein